MSGLTCRNFTFDANNINLSSLNVWLIIVYLDSLVNQVYYTNDNSTHTRQQNKTV